MLLQRLVRENEIGFNYDSMGRAEYEFGATSKSREAIARAFLANDLESRVVTLVEQYGKCQKAPIEVVVIANKEAISYIDHQCRKDLNRHWYVEVSKSSMRSDNDKIVGWMSVHTPNPIFIIKTSLENRGQRFEQFIQPFVDQIQAVEASANS